eukprot:scaffold53826_cov18-Tisochrysis_lutea.AAC.1
MSKDLPAAGCLIICLLLTSCCCCCCCHSSEVKGFEEAVHPQLSSAPRPTLGPFAHSDPYDALNKLCFNIPHFLTLVDAAVCTPQHVFGTML